MALAPGAVQSWSLRVVEAQLDPLPAALLRQLAQRVAMERRRSGNVEPVRLRVEHREAVVVLGRNHDVLHPRGLRQGHNIVRAEARGVELRRQRLVVRHRNRGIVHDPLTQRGDLLAVPRPGRDRVETPVDEHAEARLAPPGHAGIALRRSLCVLPRGDGMHGCARRVELVTLHLPPHLHAAQLHPDQCNRDDCGGFDEAGRKLHRVLRSS